MTTSRTLATALVAAPLLTCLLATPALAAGAAPHAAAIKPAAVPFCKAAKKYVTDTKAVAATTTRSGFFAGLHKLSGDLTALSKVESFKTPRANEVKLSAFYGHLYNTGQSLPAATIKSKIDGQDKLIRTTNGSISGNYGFNCSS